MPYKRIENLLKSLFVDDCKALNLDVGSWPAGMSLFVFPEHQSWELVFQQEKGLSFKCEGKEKVSSREMLRRLYVYHSLCGEHDAEATFSSRKNWTFRLFTVKEAVVDKRISQLTEEEAQEVARWIIEKARLLMGEPFTALRQTLAAAAEKQSFNDFAGEEDVLRKVKNDLAKWYLANTGSADVTGGTLLSQDEVENAVTSMQEQMDTPIGELRKNDEKSMEKRFETWLKEVLPTSASGYMSKLKAYKKASSQHDDIFLVQTVAEWDAFRNQQEHDEGWQSWLQDKNPGYASDARSAINKYKEFLQKNEQKSSMMNTESSASQKKEYCRNWIIFGAPGTGKSHRVEEKRQDPDFPFAKDVRVTFHPEYSYHDFVGSYKPVMVSYLNNGRLEKKIEYQFVPGPFALILKKALKAKEKAAQTGSEPERFLLIIEEINRARMAAVFGDVFQLLDRNDAGESDYAIVPSCELDAYLRDKNPLDGAESETGEEVELETIKIPANMYIWATMNSADQGVFPMDTAFKRRWDFEYLGIDEGAGKLTEAYGKMAPEWNRIREHINGLLQEAKINEDKQMGPFFLKKSALQDEAAFIKAFKSKVVMYLYEDAAKHKKSRVFAKSDDTYSQICNTIKNIPSLYAAFVGMIEKLSPKASDAGNNDKV